MTTDISQNQILSPYISTRRGKNGSKAKYLNFPMPEQDDLMSVKDADDDYQYFPDTDLNPLNIHEAWKQRIKSELPELPNAPKKRYIEEWRLPEYDVDVLPNSNAMSDFFEADVANRAD